MEADGAVLPCANKHSRGAPGTNLGALVSSGVHGLNKDLPGGQTALLKGRFLSSVPSL